MPTKTLFLIFTTLFTLAAALPNPFALQRRATCSTAVQNLVNGINQNIAVQKQEQQETTIIQQVLSAKTVDESDFQSAKSKLISIVNQGISIRENNQKIAPAGNGAIAGLMTVATAQAGELKLVQGLTGNPSTDNPNLAKLQSDFAGGITQNQKNIQAAQTNPTCTI